MFVLTTIFVTDSTSFTLAMVPVPGAPTGLTVVRVGLYSIHISWLAPDSDGGTPYNCSCMRTQNDVK